MSFYLLDIVDVKREALIILKKLGHKFHYDWHDEGFHQASLKDPGTYDSTSIWCIDESCKKRFDINDTTKATLFILWNGCTPISHFYIDHDGLQTITDKNGWKRSYCEKFKIMT